MSVQPTRQQPWLKGTPGADGVGNFIVAAFAGQQLVARAMLEKVDFTNTQLVQTFTVGCVPSGPLVVRFFLDDNTNASADSTSSTDAADTCGGGTQIAAPQVDVSAAQPTSVSLSLGPSCNPNVD